MNFAQRMTENRRTCILKTLESAPGYKSNESLLHMMVNDFGLTSSRDQVRAELAWLAEQGLLDLEEIAGIYVVQITLRGVDVARGHAVVPGVKRPEPS
jgi:Fe2+ or Zn2+ uptake regulation protein